LYASGLQITRPLPWRPGATAKRSSEQVRPIFWSNRPRAYIKRTADWESFPSGRWGNSASPAYGTLSDYQFMRRHTGSEKRAEKAKAAWGTSLTSIQDVCQVFTKYTSGNTHPLPQPLYANIRNIASPRFGQVFFQKKSRR